jgi:hypothetical protein
MYVGMFKSLSRIKKIMGLGDPVKKNAVVL